MKNVLSSICFLLVFNYAFSQIKVPAASPLAKSEYTVGLTTINLEYSRPSKNNRKIYGDLVPYNTLWRTGANKNSMVTFSDDVMIGGTEVKKGTYAIFAKPTIGEWEIYFYSNTENWGTPEKWDDASVAAKVMAIPVMLNNTVETFTINVGNITNTSCSLEIAWENLSVPVKIEVPTDKKVSANITQVMAGPSANDYYSAARYYREAKKDLNQALEWMDKSVSMGNNKFWHLRMKSLIEADLGNYKAAVATAKESLRLATEAGNNDYVKMNNDSIAEWSKKVK
jgi:tetratricopeptide (TPR) repeat protein